ncbi:MAG TPA: hypothetical protein VFF65_03475 [Phycisphaerales bacterium]|nr:hypothetical protein [Phycisphaerales bacterium]
MAKRPDLTHTQRKIVDRYYEHHDTIQLAKLQELIGELYLAADAKAAEKLWKRAETALRAAKVDEAKVALATAKRDVKQLAITVEGLLKKK